MIPLFKPKQPTEAPEIAARSIVSPVSGGRSENQDNFLIINELGDARYLKNQQIEEHSVEEWPRGHIRVAVLDGMGGHDNGRLAAELAAFGISKIPATSQLDQLTAALDALHLQLHDELGSNGHSAPGCTLTLLEIPAEGEMLLYHTGDSRLYQLKGKQSPQWLTLDHVPATHFARVGMMQEAEWIQQVHHENRSIISQAFILGGSMSGDDPQRSTLEVPLYHHSREALPPFLQPYGDCRTLPRPKPGTTLLLASDGLWHMYQPMQFIERWPDILNHPKQSLQGLLDELFVELIQESAEQEVRCGDNSTAVAVRFG